MSVLTAATLLWFVLVLRLQHAHQFKEQIALKQRRGEQLTSEEAKKLLGIYQDEV